MKQTIFFLSLFLTLTIGFSQNNHTDLTNIPKNDSLIKEFGLKISKKFNHKNSSFFIERINSDRIYEQLLLREVKNRKLDNFNKKFKKLFTERIQTFPKEIIDNIQKGDFYNFVSYHYNDLDKSYHLVFRYYTTFAGLDYHDYKITMLDNKLIIDDIFMFGNSQKLSETLKLFYLSNISKKDIKNILNKPQYKSIFILKNFVDAANDEAYKKAYQHITLLNNLFEKKNSFVALLKLNIASSISETAYVDSMEEIIENISYHLNINLTTLPYNLSNMDYEKADKCINNLRNFTNDPFLDFEKGNLYFTKKDYQSASLFYQNMISNFPTFDTPKFSLLVTYERTKNFKKAVELCNLIINTTDYNKSQLNDKINERLPNLKQSIPYKKWLKN